MHAQALLERCAGDPQQAAELYKSELLQVLVEKSGLTAEQAREHLHSAGYDLNRALHAIEEARFTLTQRVLRKHHRDKGQALDLIAQAIETAEQLPQAIAQLRLLQLDALAHTLEQADQRQQQLRAAHGASDSATELAARVNQDPLFNRCQDSYRQHRAQLDERLFEWVKQHQEAFPA